MDYLFATWDGGGNVGPELVLARRLVARGHRVTVLASPMLQPQVVATGARFTPWQRAPHRQHQSEPDPFADHDLHTPKEVIGGLSDQVIVGPAADYAADVEAALDAQPDNAARIVAAGAGPRLPRDTRPGEIARAVRTLLDEPSFARRSAELGAIMRADGANTVAVDELEGVVGPREEATP